MPDESKPFLTPIECALAWISDAEQVVGASLKDCADLSYERSVLSYMSGVKTVFPDEGSSYYEVTDTTAEAISIASTSTREELGVAREICASNIAQGEVIPRPLRPLCYCIIKNLDFSVAIKIIRPVPLKNFA